MKCPRCEKEQTEHAAFCEECGMVLSVPPFAGAEQISSQPEEQYYLPHGYQAPQYPPVMMPYGMPYMGDPSKNWAAIVGLVLGIISVPACCVPMSFSTITMVTVVMIVCLLIGVAAIVLSVVGMRSAMRGMAIGGLVCGIVGTTFMFIFLIVMTVSGSLFYRQ
jgi:hypothetical protein